LDIKVVKSYCCVRVFNAISKWEVVEKSLQKKVDNPIFIQKIVIIDKQASHAYNTCQRVQPFKCMNRRTYVVRTGVAQGNAIRSLMVSIFFTVSAVKGTHDNE